VIVINSSAWKALCRLRGCFSEHRHRPTHVDGLAGDFRIQLVFDLLRACAAMAAPERTTLIH
jgi:hypothetical protein